MWSECSGLRNDDHHDRESQLRAKNVAEKHDSQMHLWCTFMCEIKISMAEAEILCICIEIFGPVMNENWAKLLIIIEPAAGLIEDWHIEVELFVKYAIWFL